MLINGERLFLAKANARIERDEWNAAQGEIRAERVRRTDAAIIIVGVLCALFAVAAQFEI